MVTKSKRTNVIRRHLSFIVSAIVVAFAVPLSASAQQQLDNSRMTERTVSVSATGSTSATPDTAHISTGVMSEANTAREALNLNNAAMAKLIDGLKGLNVASKDIQTTSININPRYTNPREGKPPAINGYQANNSVRVTVRDLKRLGEVLDAAITLGANQMGGISFDVSQAEQLKDEARKAAMTNARRRADLYAAAAGVSLGQVITISEDVRIAGPRPLTTARMASTMDAVPVEAGAMQLDATVHVTWSLK